MLTFSDDDFRRQVQQETGIKPEWPAEAFDDLDEDVRQSIARIKASPFIAHKEQVRGFVYEVETGRLRECPNRGSPPAIPACLRPCGSQGQPTRASGPRSLLCDRNATQV
jgi:hypothetical protein